MNKLARIAFLQMLLGSADPSPYGANHYPKRQQPKEKRKGKRSTKVVYYTDEKGQIRRKKVQLEESEC